MIFLNVFSNVFVHAFTDECFATSLGDPVCIWMEEDGTLPYLACDVFALHMQCIYARGTVYI